MTMTFIWFFMTIIHIALARNSMSVIQVGFLPSLGMNVMEPWEKLVLQMVRATNPTVIHFLCDMRCPGQALLHELPVAFTISEEDSIGDPENGKDVISDSEPNDFHGWQGGEVSSHLVVVLKGRHGCSRAMSLLHDTQDALVLLMMEGAVERLETEFMECWNQGKVRLLGVPMEVDSHPQTLDIFSFFPYGPGRCRDTSPQIILRWNESMTLDYPALRLDGKMSNLHCCEVSISASTRFPYIESITPISGSDGNHNLQGTLRPLLDSLARKLNFTPIIRRSYGELKPRERLRSDLTAGVVGDVYFNRSDLGLVHSTWVTGRYVVRPPTIHQACYTWCLPRGYRKFDSSLAKVFRYLEQDVWCCLLAAYLMVVVTFHWGFRGRFKLGHMALLSLQALLSSVPIVPHRLTSRILFSLWAYFGVVITTAYLARMHSQTSSEAFETRLNSLRDLAESDLPLFISTVKSDSFWQSRWRRPYEDAVLARTTRFVSTELVGVYDRIRTHHDAAVLMERGACSLLLGTGARAKAAFYTIPDYCLTPSTVYFLMLPPRSALLPPLSRIMSQMGESGLWLQLSGLQSGAGGRGKRVAHARAPLALRQVVPYLKLLAAGLGLAQVVFVCELFAHGRRSKCKRDKEVRDKAE